MNLDTTLHLLRNTGATAGPTRGTATFRHATLWLPNGRGVFLLARPTDPSHTLEMRIIRHAFPARPSACDPTTRPWRSDPAMCDGNGQADPYTIQHILWYLDTLPPITPDEMAYDYGYEAAAWHARYRDPYAADTDDRLRTHRMPPAVKDTRTLVPSYDRGWRNGWKYGHLTHPPVIDHRIPAPLADGTLYQNLSTAASLPALTAQRDALLLQAQAKVPGIQITPNPFSGDGAADIRPSPGLHLDTQDEDDDPGDDPTSI